MQNGGTKGTTAPTCSSCVWHPRRRHVSVDARKVRTNQSTHLYTKRFFVCENSPNLWPTMSCVTVTGTWSFPLCTRKRTLHDTQKRLSKSAHHTKHIFEATLMIHTHTQRSSEGWCKIAHPFLWECYLQALHGCWETQRRTALRVVQCHELYAMTGVTNLSMRTALSAEWPKGTFRV